jgi:hypothetical protein
LTLLVAISLVLIIAMRIPNTIAKKDSNELKTRFRRSDNPIMGLTEDKEKWLPIVPPELVGRPLDENLEKERELLIYDIKTKNTKKIPQARAREGLRSWRISSNLVRILVLHCARAG